MMSCSLPATGVAGTDASRRMQVRQRTSLLTRRIKLNDERVDFIIYVSNAMAEAGPMWGCDR